jgi:hypothetical protein
MCIAQADLFPTKQSLKSEGTIHFFMFVGNLGSLKRVRETACAALWQIILSTKSVPADRKKEFPTSRPSKNWGIRWIFALSR